MNCLNCNIETSNPKYCSRSCAAKCNNQTSPKRTPQGKCKICQTPIINSNTYCSLHSPNASVDWTTTTYKDLKETRKWPHNQIRYLSRVAFQKSNRKRECEKCGYDKHVEVCHITSLHFFPLETPISIINSLDNLIALCPNCHWEFDHMFNRTAC